MLVREKRHRLPDNNYKGEISVAFTLCVENRFELFRNPSIVGIFTDILKAIVERFSCIVPAYCFMPDHLHLIVAGINGNADSLRCIKTYKQKSGYWLAKHLNNACWQKDFYDHILRKDENLINVVKYIFDNPVRKGLVAHWQDYPFKGSIGYSLDEILQSLA